MIHGRVMDRKRMLEIRAAGGISHGNEHEAVVWNLPRFPSGSMHDWDASEVADLIASDLGDLPESLRSI